jgi:phosphatidylglycerophosphate synthase
LTSGTPQTRAIIVATVVAEDGGAAAAQPFDGSTPAARLAEQLASLGVTDVRVVTRPAFADQMRDALGAVAVEVSPSLAGDLRAVEALARAGDGALVVVQGEIVTQREALAGLLADPRIATGALTGPGAGTDAFRVRARNGRLTGAASPFHFVRRPTGSFRGVLRVAAADRPGLAAAAGRLAALTDPEPPQAWTDELRRKRLAAADGDVVALLLVGLVRAGARVAAVPVRGFFWARPHSRSALDDAAARLPEHDEDQLRLDAAVKASDGLFTTFLVSPYSKHIARWAARRGLTPNQVTTVSLLIGLAAAAAFATGARWGLIAGAVLLQVAFTTDCVDGQLARYTRRFSTLGAWLDSVFDRTKEYAAYAGLAIGAARTGHSVWELAAAALTLQTVRHMIDFAYASAHEQAVGAVAQPPLECPSDTPGEPAPPEAERDENALEAEVPEGRRLPASGLRAWHALDALPAVTWLKKVFALPIGERFALISVTAALFDARVTFVALLAWGGAALAYQLAGRVLRTAAR